MMNAMREEMDFHHSSEQDLDRDDANLIGSRRPERAWICSDRDVWYRNPHYRGPEVPHPESD